MRFEGEMVDITLKEPLGAAAAGRWRPTARNFAAARSSVWTVGLADRLERRTAGQAGPAVSKEAPCRATAGAGVHAGWDCGRGLRPSWISRGVAPARRRTQKFEYSGNAATAAPGRIGRRVVA